MEVIVLKYVQLVCITLFMSSSNNVNCAELLVSKELNHLKLSSCIAECLDVNRQTYNLTSCYPQCANRTESRPDVNNMDESFNGSFGLYCRGWNRLLIQVDYNDYSHVANETFVYMLTVQETTNKFADHLVYLSDEPLIELRDLKASESYNISAAIISSKNKVRSLESQQHTTLFEAFKPENVTHVTMDEFYPIKGNGTHLNAVVRWAPARDKTCSYEVFVHDPDAWRQRDKEDHNLYQEEYKNLKYNSEYSVAVKGVNNADPSNPIQSAEQWMVFRTPKCENFNENKGFCGPQPIENLQVELTPVVEHKYSLNVSWDKMIPNPDYYTLEILDSNAKNDSDLKTHFSFTIEGFESSYLVKNISILGSDCVITLIANLNNLSTSFEHWSRAPKDVFKKPGNPSDVFYYVFAVIVITVLIVMYQVWRIRMIHIVNNFTAKQMEGMDLDLIKSITNRTMLEAIADLTRDEIMEIEREQINVLEMLGEGAFGLVKKAMMVRDGKKHQVAVKMLKSSCNIDDIKQFHQEITVMKSVGKHKNIVGIIGHCTSNIEELMLLTEFCDAGNLLDLLRCEFRKQFNYFDKKLKAVPAITVQKYPDNIHNFDDLEEKTSQKNLECSSRLFVVNQMYDDLNNNINVAEMNQRQKPALKAIEMTATNALYLELNDNEPKPFIIEISEPEDPQNFLASFDLVSFARQVTDGMDFLARKKVVHRDLAARNILVCSDRTAKIADFGLSRDIYQDNIYRKVGNGKLPIKWLAMESMTHQVYTSQSDVWSFGILLYEIVTLGATPYPAMGADKLLELLNTGYRMEKPHHCHQLLYNVMKSCWQLNPTDRPTFEELSDKFSHFLKLESNWDEQFIDLQKLFVKCTGETNYMKPIA